MPPWLYTMARRFMVHYNMLHRYVMIMLIVLPLFVEPLMEKIALWWRKSINKSLMSIIVGTIVHVVCECKKAELFGLSYICIYIIKFIYVRFVIWVIVAFPYFLCINVDKKENTPDWTTASSDGSTTHAGNAY